MHVDDLGDCGDRFARVGQKNDSLGRPHVELAPLVGEHESPVEILADHEAEQHAGPGLRCHGAVAKFAVAVVIGFSAPHARSEGALVELCRGEESHDQRREEQGSHCHGSPRAPAFSHLTTNRAARVKGQNRIRFRALRSRSECRRNAAGRSRERMEARRLQRRRAPLARQLLLVQSTPH